MIALRSPLVRFSAVAIVAALALSACGDDNSPAAAQNSSGTAAAGTTATSATPGTSATPADTGTAAGTGTAASTDTAASGGTELPAAELSLVAYSTPQEAYE